VSCPLYILYFANIISWTSVVGKGDHSFSGVVKEKAQESDTSEDNRAWLAWGQHMELLPAAPVQKLSSGSGAERQLSRGDGHSSLRTGEDLAFAAAEKVTE